MSQVRKIKVRKHAPRIQVKVKEALKKTRYHQTPKVKLRKRAPNSKVQANEKSMRTSYLKVGTSDRKRINQLPLAKTTQLPQIRLGRSTIRKNHLASVRAWRIQATYSL